MTFWKWSRTAASNATADSTCPFPENMAASALNDGTRGMMAAAAKYRDDQAGAIVTGGSVNAYTVASYQGFDSGPHLDGNVVAFSPHITNTGACTITIDGQGPKPLRPSPGVDFFGGELIQGTPYSALYNNSTGEVYVRGITNSPFNVPLFGGLDYWDLVAPASCFIFPRGQAISRTTYAKAFARWNTGFGAGDGSTTFNVPDVTGRLRAMLESAATRLTTAGSGVDGSIFGAAGGNQKRTLAANQIPSLHSSGNNNISVTGNALNAPTDNGSLQGGVSGGFAFLASHSPTPVTSTGTNNIAVDYTNGSQQDVSVIPPLIVCNYIIRIL